MPACAEARSAVCLTILAISPGTDDRAALTGLFRNSHWNVVIVKTVADAIAACGSRSFPVVLCERNLPDGNWKDILRFVMMLPDPPQLIVMDRAAEDQLWSEVLNLGGFDVIAEPFTARELFPSLNCAWRHWSDTLALGEAQSGGAEAPPLAVAASPTF